MPSENVRAAVLAHSLAVIEAFTTDRIEDAQVEVTEDLRRVVTQLQQHRGVALSKTCGEALPASFGYETEDRTMRDAIASERELLLSGRATTMRTYELVSLGKQAVGFPAAMALAWAAGWGVHPRTVLRRMLSNVWLGLQIHDDVVDWEEDMSRGGAWAVSLMRRQLQLTDSHERPAEGPTLRRQVLEAGVLQSMLARSRWHFRAARARARVLGAHRLAAWAADREERLGSLVSAEQGSAGYAVRAHALAAWAGEVLA
jgi:hypothetical protein